MQIRNFMIMILFLLFPLIPLGFVVNQANAARHCCACGVCQSGCTCNGTWPCLWCVAPESNSKAVVSSFSNENISVKVTNSSIPAAVLSSATERVLADIRSSFGPENLTLKIVEDIKNDLKFSCPYADDRNWQGKRLGIQAKADTEK